MRDMTKSKMEKMRSRIKERINAASSEIYDFSNLSTCELIEIAYEKNPTDERLDELEKKILRR